MSIPPPNYTQIPNVLLDEWCCRLSPPAFKILMILCRKIFGWHKTSDTISRSQLINLSGLCKPTVGAALKELIEHGLVIQIINKNEKEFLPTTYKLNIICPQDERYTDPKGEGGRSKSDLGVVKNIYQGVGNIITGGVGNIITPQKKHLTKENTINSSASSDAPLTGPIPKGSQKKKVAHEVWLTTKQSEALIERFGKEVYNQQLQELSAYKARTGKKNTSDYMAILKWVHIAVHNKNQSVRNKEKIVEKNLKGIKAIFDYLVSKSVRGNLIWRRSSNKVHDSVLNRSTTLDKPYMLKEVAAWYGLQWEEDDGD